MKRRIVITGMGNMNIPAEKVNKSFDAFLSNSFGFGGTNSTLIVKNIK
ncbi:MAG: hypothetical protein LBF59_03590 [Prevotellaceae bacterium]|jgi:3-oxoacyl-[acyl-carrier-protein] synthase-1|nr:hypothetical protein [Prevotellaceae bacterium]